MKLHHFVAATISEEGTRIRELGKALAPAVPVATPKVAPAPIAEVKLADIKKLDSPKKAPSESGDITQQIRDFAVDQMENSPITSHLHKRIRHYD
jgi:hypothetical protein